MNPGMDLLLAASWEEGIDDYYEYSQPIPALTGIMPDSSALIAYEAGQKVEKGLSPIKGMKTTGLILVILVIFVGSLSYLITYRMRRNL
jgi:hypothetical protein